MKNELTKLKSIKTKCYNLEQENEKNKKIIDELNKEINVLTTLNTGYINKEKKLEDIDEDEKLEIENLREQNKALKNNLLECDNKLKKTEEKLLKSQQKLNEQLEEQRRESDKKIQKKFLGSGSIKSSVIFFDDNKKDIKKDNIIDDNNNYILGEEEIASFSNENSEKPNSNNLDTQRILNNYKSLKEENESQKEIIKDLKKRIKELDSNYNEKDDINDIQKLNNIINEKDLEINNLEEQLKEYQKKCDDVISGMSDEDKDKQIQLLINEINSIKKKFLNDITYNNRITNFEEFIKNIEKINELNNEIIDPEIQDAFAKLNELIEIYKNNEDIINDKFGEEFID